MGLVVSPITVFTHKQVSARKDVIVKGAGESGEFQYADEELRRTGLTLPSGVKTI